MFTIRFGRLLFGASIAALCAQHLILDHVTVTKPGPESLIDLSFLFLGFLYKVGVVTLAAAIVFNYKVRSAAFTLGGLILAWILLRHVPLLIENITDPAELNSIGMALAAVGGSFIIADSSQPDSSLRQHRFRILHARLPALGKFFYGIPMIVFGVQHMLYAAFIASLIPPWIPGSNFWAYGTGLALITAGISIIFGWKSNWSSPWLGIMILLWIVLLHMPRVVTNPKDDYEWTSLFQAVAICVAAFVLRENLIRTQRRTMEEPAIHKEFPRVASKSKIHWHQRKPRLKESEI